VVIGIGIRCGQRHGAGWFVYLWFESTLGVITSSGGHVGEGRLYHTRISAVSGVSCGSYITTAGLLVGFLLPRMLQWLGKNSSTNKSRRLIQELSTHTALSIGQGFTPMRLEYVPYLRTMLLKPLLDRGSDGVEEVLRLLDEYGLSKDDFSETMQAFQFVVEKDAVLKGKYKELFRADADRTDGNDFPSCRFL
jgi:hypothetical protein